MVRHFLSEVVSTEPVMEDAVLLTLLAPAALAGQVRAGQLLSIVCRDETSYDPLLRRPYAIFRTDPTAGTLTIVVRPVGRAGSWLTRRSAGTIVDVLGPIGNAFAISPRASNVLLIAGGAGAVPLVLLANEAVASKRNVTFLIGAETDNQLLPPSLLPNAVEFVVATVDGSRGQQGVVTDLVPAYRSWADQIFACGPEPMYHALRAILRANLDGASRTQVVIERPMPCGTGVCLGCVLETRHGPKASCVDGPVFDLDEVVW